MDLITFQVRSISPLLMHSAASMATPPDPNGRRETRIPTPEVEAERGAHRMPDGQLFIPAVAFRGSLINGGIGWKIGKRSAPRVLGSAVFLTEECCRLTDPVTGERIATYEIDIRRVVIKKAAVSRARPKVASWATSITFEFDPDFVSPRNIEQAFQNAGRVVGVLDFRPFCPNGQGGPFGRYSVALS